MEASWWQLVGRQTRVLLWRNRLLKRRNLRQTALEIFYPVYILVVLLVLANVLPNTTHPPVASFAPRTYAPEQIVLPVGSGRVLLFAPNTTQVEGLVARASDLLLATAHLDLTVQGVATSDDVETYYNDHPLELFGAIVVDVDDEQRTSAQNPSYTIRMNSSFIPSTNSLTGSEGDCRTEAATCTAELYYYSGLLCLQRAFDAALMEDQFGVVPSVNMSSQRMPMDDYTESNLTLELLTAIYMVLAFYPIVYSILVNVVIEKEKKIKEGMMMMGLQEVSFILSWFVFYVVYVGVTTLIMSIVSVYGRLFPKSNVFLIWILLYAYGLSTIAFSFILTPFFSKSKVAGAIGSMTSVLFSIVYIPFSTVQPPPSAATRYLACLLSPTALSLSMSEAIRLESMNEGLTFQTFTTGATVEGFSAFSCFWMMILDTAFYFFLAWYLDSVVPTEYGVKRPWYFLCTPSFWARKKDGEDGVHTTEPLLRDDRLQGKNDSNVEPVPEELRSKIAVQIHNLSKTYTTLWKRGSPPVVALDDVDLEMYEDQIFGLLGHNGAGKTTLISILSGLYDSSSGSANIYGIDVRYGQHQLRRMMGVCPQQDILFDTLTVEEHLKVLAGIKDIPSSQVEGEVNRIAREVDLVDQLKNRASNLSGGQKRKLSVGMALLGDPKILFLDEPTSGMDPYSRRKLWDFLQGAKKNRVTVLTTHFMDEADILADRKAILSEGHVRCVGSSLFLKNRFGIGYHLDVFRKDPEADVEAITQVVRSKVKDAKVDSHVGAELSYRLPLESVSSFPGLFQTLDSELDHLHLDSYAVAMTTLEEVFLRMEHETHAHAHEGEKLGDDDDLISSLDADTRNKLKEILGKENANVINPKRQFQMLVKTRMIQIMRNPKSYIFGVMFPLVFLIIGFSMTLLDTSLPEPDVLQLNSNLYGDSIVPYSNETDQNLDMLVKYLAAPMQLRNASTLYDSIRLDNDTSYQAAFEFGGNFSYENATISFNQIFNSTAVHIFPLWQRLISSAQFSTLAEIAGKEDPSQWSISTSIHPLPFSSPFTFNGATYTAYLFIGFALSFAIGGFAIDLVKERQLGVKHMMSVMGTSPAVYFGATYVRDQLLYGLLAVVAVILVFAFQIPLAGKGIFPFILLLITYQPSMILFAYLCSYMFDNYETATSVLPAFIVTLASIPYYVVSGLDMSGYTNEAAIINYIFLAIDPPFAIFSGVYYIQSLELVAAVFGTTLTMADYFAATNKILWAILVPLVTGVISAAVIYWKEFADVHKKNMPWDSVELMRRNERYAKEEDADVFNERNRVKSENDDLIQLRDIRKTYDKPDERSFVERKFSKRPVEQTVIVDDMTFGVRKGECFGLLGPNGAGKTTTISMLTGSTRPTCGTGTLGGYNIETNLPKAFQQLGFCPQFDSLIPDVTTEEHLRLFAVLKGVPEAEVPTRVQVLLEVMNIKEHAKKLTKDLSGGTKRKLSFAIALIGAPNVLVLDEPSSGMDPASRRHLWIVISESIQSRSAILTTHSMDEADTLCKRIGIMVKGRLQCLGTSQHLKQKFAEGFVLDLNTTLRKAPDVKEFVKDNFQDAVLSEEFGSRLTFKISNSKMTLATMFGLLEEHKQDLEIEDYSFSQTSLEQVFIGFAKKQDQPPNDETPNDGSNEGSVLPV